MNRLLLLPRRAAHTPFRRQVLEQNRPRCRYDSTQPPKQNRINTDALPKDKIIEGTRAKTIHRAVNQVRKEVSSQVTATTPSPAWYQRLGPVSTFLAWFHKTQSRRPYAVQLCSTTIVYLAGDISAQRIGGEEYDPWRTVRMLTIGAIASIPGYRWFLYLGRSFNYTGQPLRSLATKVVVQQIVFAPTFNLYFFSMQAALAGQNLEGIYHRVVDAVPKSVVRSAQFWPLVTAFTFHFVLPQYRFMASGVFAIIWQTYLSFLNRDSEKKRLKGNMPAMSLLSEGRSEL